MYRVIFLIVLAVLVATPVLAGGERVLSSDTGFRLTHGSTGPSSVDVAVDGNATIKFIWLVGGLTTAAGDSLKAEPVPNTGDSTAFALRSALPPRNFGPWLWGSDGPDSCYVDLDTATEVIVTW